MELAPLVCSACTIVSCPGHQAPFLRCFTCEMWRPRQRCTLQHSSQRSTPRFMDAQAGSGAPQSPHTSGTILSFPRDMGYQMRDS
uniref:Uncharacterized protein n=1 Tax=Ixodes ricinus TaxID=34613 RepID=A0A6B0U0K2_IXORI